MEENVRSSTSGRLMMIRPKRQQLLLPVPFNKTRSRKKFQELKSGVDIDLIDITKFGFLSSLQLKPVPHLFGKFFIENINKSSDCDNDDDGDGGDDTTITQPKNNLVNENINETEKNTQKDCDSLFNLLLETSECNNEIKKTLYCDKNEEKGFVNISNDQNTSFHITQTEDFDISLLLGNKEKSPSSQNELNDLNYLLEELNEECIKNENADSNKCPLDNCENAIEEKNIERNLTEKDEDDLDETVDLNFLENSSLTKSTNKMHENKKADDSPEHKGTEENEKEETRPEFSLRDVIKETHPQLNFSQTKVKEEASSTDPLTNLIGENVTPIRPKIENTQNCFPSFEDITETLNLNLNMKIKKQEEEEEDEENEESYTVINPEAVKLKLMRREFEENPLKIKTEHSTSRYIKKEDCPLGFPIKIEPQTSEDTQDTYLKIKGEILPCLKQEPQSEDEDQERELESRKESPENSPNYEKNSTPPPPERPPPSSPSDVVYDYYEEDATTTTRIRTRSTTKSTTTTTTTTNGSPRLGKLDLQLENEVIALIKNPNIQINAENEKSPVNKTKKKPEPQCKICSQTFSNYVKLKEHKTLHMGEKPYPCLKCGEGFPSLEQLIGHLRVHQGKWPFECKKCGKGFSTLKGLGKHQPIHILKKVSQAKKTFKCEVCDKEFRKVCDLDRHMRVHTGEKPSVCKICNQRFQQQHNLNKHLLIHTQEKPHKCDICDKRFGRKDVLNRHLLTHSVTKPFGCNECPKTFIRASQLNAHMERNHKAVL